MAYSIELASKLTGASVPQLRRLMRTGVLTPEFQEGRQRWYSYRDIVALRSIMWLRGSFSLQQVRKVLDYLERFDLDSEHLSDIRFAKAGKTILVHGDDGFLDVLAKPGARELHQAGSLEDIFGAFKTFRQRPVPRLDRPSAHLTIDQGTMGGLPVIEGTRIPFDTIAQLVDGVTIRAEDISHYYPQVTPDQAQDAIDFADSLRPRKRAAA